MQSNRTNRIQANRGATEGFTLQKTIHRSFGQAADPLIVLGRHRFFLPLSNIYVHSIFYLFTHLALSPHLQIRRPQSRFAGGCPLGRFDRLVEFDQISL